MTARAAQARCAGGVCAGGAAGGAGGGRGGAGTGCAAAIFVLCLARRLGGLARSGGLRPSIYAAVSQQLRFKARCAVASDL